MQNSTATMENGLAASYRIKHNLRRTQLSHRVRLKRLHMTFWKRQNYREQRLDQWLSQVNGGKKVWLQSKEEIFFFLSRWRNCSVPTPWCYITVITSLQVSNLIYTPKCESYCTAENIRWLTLNLFLLIYGIVSSLNIHSPSFADLPNADIFITLHFKQSLVISEWKQKLNISV